MLTNNALPMLGRRTANAGLCSRPDSAAWVVNERTQVKLAERIDLANELATGAHDTRPAADPYDTMTDVVSRWEVEDAIEAGIDNPDGVLLNGMVLDQFVEMPSIPVDHLDQIVAETEPGELAELLDQLHDAGVDALEHMRVPDHIPSLWGDAVDPYEVQWGFTVSTRPPGSNGRRTPAHTNA